MESTKVNNWLKEYCKGLSSSSYSSAYEYSLISEGKRIRPSLCLMVGEVLGAEESLFKEVCIAIELLHASSLIHDDLPALDNSNFRRDKPACHKVYGEGVSLLVGNMMISDAFNLISSSNLLNSNQKTFVTTKLSQAFSFLCDGQILDEDVSSSNNLTSIEELFKCHLNKTAALFAFSASVPIVGIDPTTVHYSSYTDVVYSFFENSNAYLLNGETLAQFLKQLTTQFKTSNNREVLIYNLLYFWGLLFGLVFQITDDLLDQDESDDGGSILRLLSAQEAEKVANSLAELSSLCCKALEPLNYSCDNLRNLMNSVLSRKI